MNQWVGNIAEDQAKLHQGDMASNDYRGATIVSVGLWRDVAKGNSRGTQGTSYGFDPSS